MKLKNDYCGKQYRHPVKIRAERGVRPLQVRLVQALGFAVAVIAGANFLPMLTHSTITALKVEGAKYIDAGQIVALAQNQLRESRLALLPQQVGAFFNVRKMRNELQKEFPFANWFVSKDSQGAVSITVEERQAELVWQSKSKLFYLDSSGQAFAEVLSKDQATGSDGSFQVIRHEISGDTLPLVQDEQGKLVNLGDRPITDDVIQFITSAAGTLGDLLTKQASPVVNYSYDTATRRLTIRTVVGFDIYLSSDQSVDEQIDKIRAVIAQGITEKAGLRYIDVRFGQKVFYQ